MLEDDGVDVVAEIVDDEGAAEGESVISSVTTYAPLESIWDDDMVSKLTSPDGKKEWKCLWCKNVFAQWNHSKALHHLAKQKGQNIKLCGRAMDAVHRNLYCALFSKQEKKRQKRAYATAEAVATGDHALRESGAALLSGRKKARSGVLDLTSASVASAVSLDTKLHAVGGSSTSSRKMNQTKLFDVPDPQAESELTMAIADMIHSCGLPFSLAGHHKFRKVLSLSKVASSKYKPPSRNQISGTFPCRVRFCTRQLF
jgi:hypothetical protein